MIVAAGQLLKGRVAIVTGSSRGLGRAYALALARAGACVTVNGRTPGGVQHVAEGIRALGGEALPVAGSVALWEVARRLVEETVRHFGRVDILVNNAALVRDHMLFNMTEEEWDEVVDTHLKGSFACARFAAAAMRSRRGGRIINIGSRAFRGSAGQSNNAAAKGGLMALTWTWAQELAQYGITVNAVLPRARTELSLPVIERALRTAREAGLPAATPADVGFPEPEAIAPLIVYLASEESAWLNGQVLGFDGRQIEVWALAQPAYATAREEGWSLDDLRRSLRPLLADRLQPLQAVPGAGPSPRE